MKTRINGPIVSLVILLVIGNLMSCKKDFLDRQPQGQYTTDDLTGGSFESQVFGMYAGLRSWGTSGLPLAAVQTMRSDDAIKGSSTSDGVDAENVFDKFQYSKDFWLTNSYWSDHFALISLTNNVIDAIDSAQLTDEISMTNKAEAKFLRAYAYFNLVRAYGEVPKIDFKITDAAQANIAKSPVSDIYALIDADLQEAVTNLPLTWDAKYIGRLTKGAALALQAENVFVPAKLGRCTGFSQCGDGFRCV